MYFPERLFIYSLLAVSGWSTYKNTHVKNHKLVWPEIVNFMKASHTLRTDTLNKQSQSGSCMSISQGKELNVFSNGQTYLDPSCLLLWTAGGFQFPHQPAESVFPLMFLYMFFWEKFKCTRQSKKSEVFVKTTSQTRLKLLM